MSERRMRVGLSALVFGLFAGVAQANLLSDGGFEQPLVPTGLGGATIFSVGSVIAGDWQVVGSASGNVAISQANYFGGANIAEEGIQLLDLTGNTDNNAATGVEQAFSTTAGLPYLLSFYLGTFNTALYPFSGDASAVVKLNGTAVQTATNSDASSGTSEVPDWKLFSYAFTATGSSTTLDIINNTAAGVGFAGLDNVSVSQVPEPSAGEMVLCIVGLFGLRRFRFMALSR